MSGPLECSAMAARVLEGVVRELDGLVLPVEQWQGDQELPSDRVVIATDSSAPISQGHVIQVVRVRIAVVLRPEKGTGRLATQWDALSSLLRQDARDWTTDELRVYGLRAVQVEAGRSMKGWLQTLAFDLICTPKVV